jgi:hypothetical protein
MWSPPAMSGSMWHRVYAVCKAFEHYGSVDPNDKWLPQFQCDDGLTIEKAYEESTRSFLRFPVGMWLDISTLLDVSPQESCLCEVQLQTMQLIAATMRVSCQY